MDKLQRVTAPTLEVLAALLAAGSPVWGLLVIKETGRLPGTVYPLLERLEGLGWIESSWDEDAERSGPRRRLYEFTTEGRAAAAELVETHAKKTVRARRAPGKAATA